eukprot:472157_1
MSKRTLKNAGICEVYEFQPKKRKTEEDTNNNTSPINAENDCLDSTHTKSNIGLSFDVITLMNDKQHEFESKWNENILSIHKFYRNTERFCIVCENEIVCDNCVEHYWWEWCQECELICKDCNKFAYHCYHCGLNNWECDLSVRCHFCVKNRICIDCIDDTYKTHQIWICELCIEKQIYCCNNCGKKGTNVDVYEVSVCGCKTSSILLQDELKWICMDCVEQKKWRCGECDIEFCIDCDSKYTFGGDGIQKCEICDNNWVCNKCFTENIYKIEDTQKICDYADNDKVCCNDCKYNENKYEYYGKCDDNEHFDDEILEGYYYCITAALSFSLQKK